MGWVRRLKRSGEENIGVRGEGIYSRQETKGSKVGFLDGRNQEKFSNTAFIFN